MNNAPDPWSDETAEEPLQEAHQEHVVVEALIIDAGADHGSDSAGEWNEVEDGADQGVVVLE